MKIRKNIIFDQNQIMLFGKFEQAVCRCRLYGGAGRIVNAGIAEIEFWPVLGAKACEAFQIRALGCLRHADKIDALRQ